jgi:hypothetical protein
MTGLVLVACLSSAQAAVRAVDVSRQAGVFEVSRTYGAHVHDFNGDGRDDFLFNPHYQRPARLYRNDGGRFNEVNRGTFAKTDRHDCDWADVNADGLEDVYCTVGGRKGGNGPNPNQLWLQRPDGGFVNRADAYGVRDRFGRGRDTAFLDVNGDPFPDLYVGNAQPREDGRRGANQLFINRRGNNFRRATGYGVNRRVGGDSVEGADYDADGDDDLLVCGQGRLQLYQNRGGRDFKEVSRRTRVTGTCKSVTMLDMNGDGRLDLVRLTARRLAIESRRGGRAAFRRTLAQRPLREGQAFAVGDATGDGRPDVYVVQAGGRGTRRNPGSGRERPDLMLGNRLHRGNRSPLARIDIPQTRRGAGDSVAALDYDGNGLSDFLVMNGHQFVQGPVRLIAFRR